jgi:hypothetical protein
MEHCCGMTHRMICLTAALLAIAGCHRPAQNPSAAASGEPLAVTDDPGLREGTHEPGAMTAIDVATGDLAGWSDYAGDRAVPAVAAHAYGAAQSAAATNQTADMLEGSVATSDENVGVQPGAGAAATPAEGDQVPSNAGPSQATP